MIQIDIKMPKSCGDCHFIDDNGDYPYCLVLQQNRGYTFDVNMKRFPNCPLKEVDNSQYEEEMAKRKRMCKVLFNRCRVVGSAGGAMCAFCGMREECEEEHTK